jgi:hypothetical protein
MCRFDPAAVVTESWTLRIASYAPTQNSLGGNTKDGRKYRGWRKRWETEFGTWLATLPPAKRRRRVTITREFGKGKRAFDRVNFMGGCKPLLDTLTNFGALYDDSELWCEDHYAQRKSEDGIDYVTVLVEELS